MERLTNLIKLLAVGDLAVRRNPLFYADAARTLQTLSTANLAARREWTRRRLQEVLWAARRCAYGRKVHGGDSLADWPLLTKDIVRADPRDFHSGSTLLTVKASTGGTSGSPLPLVRSLRSIAFEQACLDHMQHLLGADARTARCAVLRTDSIKDPNDFRPPYWVSAGGGRRLVFSSMHLNAATVGLYADALTNFQPDVLLAYPTSLDALVRLLDRANRKLTIPRVMCSSEMLHQDTWQLAQTALGCTVLDYYGQAERVAFAYAMAPRTYRFLPGYAHVEFVRRGVEDDLQVLEIVGTSLWNLAMPLVRYCTGDLLRVPAHWQEPELEELALGIRTFDGVEGRDSDILVTPDGVKITGLSHFHRDVANIERIQIIQETPREVRICVLPGAHYSPHDAEHLLENARKKLPRTMRVEIQTVDHLERTPRGKTPFVIHRSAVKEQLRQREAHGSVRMKSGA